MEGGGESLGFIHWLKDSIQDRKKSLVREQLRCPVLNMPPLLIHGRNRK